MPIYTTVFWVPVTAAKRVVLAHGGNVAVVVVGVVDVAAITPMFTLGKVCESVQMGDIHIHTVAAFRALLWVGKVPVVVGPVAAMTLAHVRTGTLVNKTCLVHLVPGKRTCFIPLHSGAPRGMFKPRHVIGLINLGTDTAIVTRRLRGGCSNKPTWRTQVASGRVPEHGSKCVVVAAAAKYGKDDLLETAAVPPNCLPHNLGDVHWRVIVRPAAKGRENQRVGPVF